MERKVSGALLLIGVLMLCIHLGAHSSALPDLDIDIQFNLTVSTKADQGTDS